MTRPIVVDYIGELGALEEEMRAAGERANVAVLCAAKIIDADSTPVLPSVRANRESIAFLIQAVIEMKTVNDGLVSGMLEFIKTAMEGLGNGS